MAKDMRFFHEILRSMYDLSIELGHTVSIDTWPTQLAGNRASRFPVLVTGKIGDTIYTVKLPPGFALARVGGGYNLDIVQHDKNRVGNLWKNYAHSNEKHPDKEVMAAIGFYICQILSGIPLSYESGGKVAELGLIVDKCGFSSLTVKVKVAAEETVEYDLPSVKALFTGLMPVYNRFKGNLKEETAKSVNNRTDRTESEQHYDDVFSDSPVKRQPAKRQPAKRQPANPAKVEL